MSIQEAIDLTDNIPHLPRLFGPDILGRLPQDGQPRVRRTMLGVIGTMSVISFIHCLYYLVNRCLFFLVRQLFNFIKSGDPGVDACGHPSHTAWFAYTSSIISASTSANANTDPDITLGCPIICSQCLAKSILMPPSWYCFTEPM